MPKEIEHLVLADGTKINTSTGLVVEEEEIEEAAATNSPAVDESQRELALVGPYKISDLPESGKLMSVIAAVSALELWGLPPIEIAKVLNTDTEKVEALQHSESYIEFKQGVSSNVVRALQDDVRGIIALASKKAAEKLVDTMNGKSKSELPFKAAGTILDRGGFGPQQTVNHNHKMEDELVIRVIRDTDAKHLPTVDI